MSRSLIPLTSSRLEVTHCRPFESNASHQETPTMEFLACTLATGIGATLLIDAWAIVRKRVLDTPLPNYGMVGRWVAHLVLDRQLRHASIAAAPAVRGERVIGWATHYVVGISFAAILLGICGIE